MSLFGMDGMWSALGGIASTMISTSASKSAQARSYWYSRALQEHQYDLNQRGLLESPSSARAGIVKAGFNPLLALGSQSNSITPSATMSAPDMSGLGRDFVNSALDAMRLRNENKLNKSQVALNKSQEDLNTQATYKTFADELKSRADAQVSSAQEAKLINDIHWDNMINDATLKQIIANTKYTNERSRGFSASSSRNYSGGAFGIKGGYSESNSKSW